MLTIAQSPAQRYAGKPLSSWMDREARDYQRLPW